MALWPVFIWFAMQEDDPELFEVGDVVTWPVLLVDAAVEPGWREDVGVHTPVKLTVDDEARGWAATADFEVVSRLSGAPGSTVDIRAGLTADFFDAAFFQSCVTGTVRRIEIASTCIPLPDPELREDDYPNEGWTSDTPEGLVKLPIPQPDVGRSADARPEPWSLTETPVAPLRFAHPRSGAGRIDHGILVHLEVFRPHCRCREIGSLSWGTGRTYAMRHLRQISPDRTPGSTRYRCLETGLVFAEHSWTPRPDPLVPDYQPSPQVEFRREDQLT